MLAKVRARMTSRSRPERRESPPPARPPSFAGFVLRLMLYLFLASLLRRRGRRVGMRRRQVLLVRRHVGVLRMGLLAWQDNRMRGMGLILLVRRRLPWRTPLWVLRMLRMFRMLRVLRMLRMRRILIRLIVRGGVRGRTHRILSFLRVGRGRARRGIC